MANVPAIVLSYEPAGPEFAISEDCIMPTITATATLQNITPDSKLPLVYTWKASLVFKGVACAHSLSRVITHPDVTQKSGSNKFPIRFTQVRGGDLTISVTVQGGTLNLSKTSENLKVVGTNPSIGKLTSSLDVPRNAGFRKLMRLESRLRQFRAPSCPLFSADNLGGVGICQVTNPTPTADQVWSWKENVAAGWSLYQTKERVARAYPKHVRDSAEFKALVKAYNDQRHAKAVATAAAGAGAAPSAAGVAAGAAAAAAAVRPLIIHLPDYTDEQLERDTLRGFNGYAGGLHEYRVQVDANGLLVVTEDKGGTTGTAHWEQLTAADRTAYYDKINLDANKRGDPNYVDDVEGQASF